MVLQEVVKQGVLSVTDSLLDANNTTMKVRYIV